MSENIDPEMPEIIKENPEVIPATKPEPAPPATDPEPAPQDPPAAPALDPEPAIEQTDPDPDDEEPDDDYEPANKSEVEKELETDEPAIDPEVIPVDETENVDWGLVIFILLLVAAGVAGFIYWTKKGQ